MNTENFSLAKLHDLVKNTGIESAKEYVKKFLYDVEAGIFINNPDPLLISQDIFNQKYLTKFPKDLRNWFRTELLDIYSFTVDTHAERINQEKLLINNFRGFKHMKVKKYKDYSDKIKSSVDLMLNLIKKVWCNDNDESYSYILKWLANMMQGNKNETVLYLKGVEGIGKSTVTTFIKDFVLGKSICIESDGSPLKTQYNRSLESQLLVVFEELSTTEKEWSLVSSQLKTMVTSNDIVYNDKYIRAYKSKNINNYIINTNVNALKHSNGRRIYICDLNPCKKGDTKFWRKIRSSCFSDNVGEAFYAYFKEIDVSKFISSDFPLTERKKLSLNDRLHVCYKFIKFNYIMQDKDLDLQTKKLYEEFCKYLDFIDFPDPKGKRMTKNNFISKLSDVGINYSVIKNKCTYSIDVEQLKEIATKFSWHCEDDQEEFEENNMYKSNTDQLHCDILKMVPIDKYTDALLKIEALENEIKSLKKTKKTKKTKRKVIRNDNIDSSDIFDQFENLV